MCGSLLVPGASAGGLPGSLPPEAGQLQSRSDCFLSQSIVLCTTKLDLDWVRESEFEIQETQWMSFSYILSSAVISGTGSDVNVSATACMLNHCINFSLLLSMKGLPFPKSLNDVAMEFIRS